MGRNRVLIVEDDEPIRRILEEFLRFRGFETAQARSAEEALQCLEQIRCDLVLSDIRMPGMGGIELLRRVVREYPESAVVILSGCDDVKLAVEAMKSGAFDFIVKPFRVQDVADTIAGALAQRDEKRERDRHVQELESALRDKAGELRRTLADLHEASEVTLEALVAALDAREHETRAHSKRVSEYSVHLAATMGVSGEDLDIVRRGSMLHDVGKIGISDTILLKPGRLTEAEWTEMKKHPQIGYWIVNGVDGLREPSEIVLSHHEWFNGKGYPRGLNGESIPLGARVFSVVDTLDAITSDRPYQKGRSYEDARQEIARGAGTQFDPDVVERFMEVPLDEWEGIRGDVLRENPRGIPQFQHLVFT